MQNWKKFPRVFLFIMLILGLCAGLIAPRLERVEAAPREALGNVDLSLVINNLSAADQFPNIGDSVTFTIKVTNNDAILAATGVTVKDLLPAGLTYKSDDGGGTYNSSTGIWGVGALGAGVTAQLKITATVTLLGPIRNWAEIWHSNQGDPDSNPGNGSTTEDDDDFKDVNPLVSDLSITNAVNNPTPNKGENITFTITINNAGPDTAVNVTVKDLLPAGVTHVSNDGSGSYNPTTGIWAVGSLLPSGVGSSNTLNIVAKVTASGTITNSAEVWTSDQYDPNSTVANGVTTEDDYASVSITPKVADLSITKTINNPTPNALDPVIFTITVSNAGPDAATTVTIKDLLPADFSYVSDDSGGNYNSGTGIWIVGTIANGSSATVNINAMAANNNVKTNWAEVWTSDQFDPDSIPGNGSKTTDDDAGAPSADLSVAKTADTTTPNVGANVVFTITVSNAGPGNATNVAVKDLLPSGLTYVSDTGSGAYNNGTGLWSVGTLANGNTAVLKITATAASNGSTTNSSEIWTSDQYDADSTVANGITTEDDYASVTITSTYPTMSVIISEVAWAGTAASGSDEWVELYNPGTSPIDVTGWKLQDSSTTIVLSGISIIPAGGFFLLEDREEAVDVTANQINSSLSLSNGGETLKLLDGSGTLIDSANSNGGAWPAGSSSTYGTMERIFSVPDSDTAWTTNTGIVKNGLDADGNPIWGTPKFSSPPTPTPIITPTPSSSMSVTISEVAWAGTSASSSDEWVELYNPGSSAVNISGWTLTDGTTPIVLSGSIPAGSFFLLEDRQEAVSDVTADQIDSSLSLSNSGETLKLLDGSATLIDSANLNGGAWPAGSSSTYGTMERIFTVPDSDTAWTTNTGVIKNGKDADGYPILGTPKSFSPSTPTPTATATITSTPTLTATPSSSMTVMISEVAWAGTAASSSDEWVELYNPGSSAVTITGWTLTDGSSPIVLSGSVPAGGFFLLEDRQEAVSDVAADQISGALSLSNSGETLELLDGSGAVIDSANSNGGAWPAGSSSTYGTMERIFTVADSDIAWITNTGVIKNGKDANGSNIWGTPKSFSSPTPTPTRTASPTITRTPTITPTITSTPPTTRILQINEVAWMGTLASSSDEWIEIYNSSTKAVNLSGWKLVISDVSSSVVTTIKLKDVSLASGDYYVIAPETDVFKENLVDQTANLGFNNNGERVYLKDSNNYIIDTANCDGGKWPAGDASSYASMERYKTSADCLPQKDPDSTFAWVTYANTVVVAHDRSNNAIKGTPGRANWTETVTITPTAVPTAVRYVTSTPLLQGRLIINEFLPRPGYDWNQDGRVDVFDEFIEIKNIGNADIDTKSWKLDDVDGADSSSPYSLPSLVLRPGQRVVYFGLDTNILLSDGGDTVRLVGPDGKEYDKYKYIVADVEDKSTCRLPDGNGSWYGDCMPTPNLINTRDGVAPSMPGGESFESPVCSLPDTLPLDFLFAECRGYGANIWRSMLWDATGWQGDLLIPESDSKWESFFE
jgi:uncharacterized repeat protein (TIGR01451 family)